MVTLKIQIYFGLKVRYYGADLSETIDIDIENQDMGRQDQVLVLVLTGFRNQGKSWYWS